MFHKTRVGSVDSDAEFCEQLDGLVQGFLSVAEGNHKLHHCDKGCKIHVFRQGLNTAVKKLVCTCGPQG